jgi:hypothetical protein
VAGNEQAATIVHALSDTPSRYERERLVEIVQNGARHAWRMVENA